MLAAGLVAKKAVEKGLNTSCYIVKTSLAPGSKVVTGYLEDSGLNEYFDQIGFNTVGYGCTTCIGNSGPLFLKSKKQSWTNDLFVSSVLSGNRNFEGRVHPLVKANYLASPPLVVAYALAGTVDIDLEKDPIGKDKDGKDVFFTDIWPTTEEVNEVLNKVVTRELFQKEYARVFTENEAWNAIETSTESLYTFDENSTYIQNPPFFKVLSKEPAKLSKHLLDFVLWLNSVIQSQLTIFHQRVQSVKIHQQVNTYSKMVLQSVTSTLTVLVVVTTK